MPAWTLPADSISELVKRLALFMAPYGQFFGRVERKRLALMYVEGRLQQLERRTLEPIATAHGAHRRPLQRFVGEARWPDEEVRKRMCEDVAAELGTSDGVLIMDASSFPKWGTESVGVQRQWCGRLGKKENCQVGEFLTYASPNGHTLVDCRLYLPEWWAEDSERRAKTHVPQDVEFRKGWELAAEMVEQRSSVLPHQWVIGDDAYGRVVALRKRLNSSGERYLLEVPSNTNVRLRSDGESCRADQVAKSLSSRDWSRLRTRDGEKGPIEVRATKMRVTTGDDKDARRETLLIVENCSSKQRWYYLSNAKGVSVAKMAKAAACRHYVEQSLELGKGEVGLDEYEVRSWVGWIHHMTLSMLALLFIVIEKNRLQKNSGAHRAPGSLCDLPTPRAA